MALPTIVNGVAINRGTSTNLVDGINGVASPGTAQINMPVNRRIHDMALQCTAVNYSGGTALATVTLTGSGSGATVTFTATNGQPNALTIAGGGTGYSVNDTFSVTDPTGTGAIFKVSTVSSGAITAAVYNAGTGTASAVNPASLISTVKLLVNGVIMRDITATFIQMIQQANNVNSVLGTLPMYFTEPWRKIIRGYEAMSWDLYGQNTFQLSISINSGWLLPGVAGTYEFDYLRNQRVNAQGQAVANLEPVTHHLYTFPLASGVNAITTIPVTYPIVRMWLLGSSPGNLTYLRLLQDGNTRLEGTVAAINDRYEEDGFQFGQSDYLNQTQTSAKPLGLNPLAYFDAAIISDPEQRYGKALKFASPMTLYVTSSATQTLSLIVEALPGAYAA